MKPSLTNPAAGLSHRRESHLVMRQQATVRCPECGARVKVEAGVMYCTRCDWKCSIHDVA